MLRSCRAVHEPPGEFQNPRGPCNCEMQRFVSLILLCFAAVAPFMNLRALADVVTCSGIVLMRERSDSVSIAELGGFGDGVTVNTEAFRRLFIWLGV